MSVAGEGGGVLKADKKRSPSGVSSAAWNILQEQEWVEACNGVGLRILNFELVSFI